MNVIKITLFFFRKHVLLSRENAFSWFFFPVVLYTLCFDFLDKGKISLITFLFFFLCIAGMVSGLRDFLKTYRSCDIYPRKEK